MDDVSAVEPGSSISPLVGRDAELARLRRTLAAARAGQPVVALVLGEAGTGKSCLIDAAFGVETGEGVAGDLGRCRSDGGPLVVKVSGDEAEADLDHGVLDQLVRRTPGAGTEAVPGARPGVEPRHIEPAPLRLLDVAPPDRPCVVVVDDAQWADQRSLDALATAVDHRHGDESGAVVLCVACRPEGIDRLPHRLTRLVDVAGVRIELGPLGTDAVSELARQVLGRRLPPPAVQRLRAHTAGNPLHTRALLDELPFDILARNDALPAPRSYALQVPSRLATCSPAARSMAEALAVLGRRASLADVSTVAGVDVAGEAVGELADCGIAQLVTSTTEPALAFAHGMAHASVAAGLAPSRRAALHAAAAAVTRGDEALRHRLAAAHGSEPELVAAARRAADQHAAVRAREAAARLLLDAAPLADDLAVGQHLTLVAASYLVATGRSLGPLADRVAELPDCAHRGFVLGRLALERSGPTEAAELLARAWEQVAAEAEAADLAEPLADLLAMLALRDRRLGDAVTWARRALAVEGDSATSAPVLCHGLALQGRVGDAERELTALLAPERSGRRSTTLLGARLGRGILRTWSNDLDGADRDLADAAAAVNGHGMLLTEVVVGSYRAESALRSGRWPEALDAAEAVASLVDHSSDVWAAALPHAVAAVVLASQGRMEQARRHAETAGAGADAAALVPAGRWTDHASFGPAPTGGQGVEMAAAVVGGLVLAPLWAARARFGLAAASGDDTGVVAMGDRMAAAGWAAVPEGVHHWRATYVGSLVAVDRLDDAASVTAALAAASEGAPADASVAADAARARGLLAAARGDHVAADEAFAAGLALDPQRSRPFERALLELSAGAHRRRTGRRRSAVDLLARAADRFDALGARAWCDRVDREIERCSWRPRSRSEAAEPELTAQERLVAQLVAVGHTNREVAARLLISAKTVEHHLGHIYTKLGVRSRTQLAARLPPASPR